MSQARICSGITRLSGLANPDLARLSRCLDDRRKAWAASLEVIPGSKADVGVTAVSTAARTKRIESQKAFSQAIIFVLSTSGRFDWMLPKLPIPVERTNDRRKGELLPTRVAVNGFQAKGWLHGQHIQQRQMALRHVRVKATACCRRDIRSPL